MTTLPPETIDAIAGHLHGDTAALLACSLTCKNLLISSRCHLFSELSIKLHTRDLFPLLELLSSSSNQIAPFVRRFVLDNIASFIFHNGRTDVVRAIRTISRLKSLLPSVMSVRFSNFDLEHLPEEIALQLFSQFRDFRDLELFSLHFYRFSEFVDLVCGFPGLERLWMKWVRWTHNGRSVQSLGRAFPLIGWHIYGNCRSMDLSEWLSAHDPPPMVHTLFYDAECDTEKWCIRRLLLRTAPAVEHLQISFPIFIAKDNFKETLHDFIDLSGCTNLRSLRLKQILLWPGDIVSTTIRPWIPRILSQIASDQLRELVFELHFAPTSQDEMILEEFDWKGVAKALSQSHFRNLHTICVIMGPGVTLNFAETVRIIREEKFSAFKAIVRMHFLKTGERIGW